MTVTKSPNQYNLVGTHAKLILRTDENGHGGKIEVDWKCNMPTTTISSTTPTTRLHTTSSKPVTNTLKMAKALLTGNVSPKMGLDYGRGLFDLFL